MFPKKLSVMCVSSVETCLDSVEDFVKALELKQDQKVVVYVSTEIDLTTRDSSNISFCNYTAKSVLDIFEEIMNQKMVKEEDMVVVVLHGNHIFSFENVIYVSGNKSDEVVIHNINSNPIFIS